jgi:spore maturation protein CgeB
MRIFLAIPGSPNVAIESSLWRKNLHDPLVAMGHDVVLREDGILERFDLDPAAPATAPARARFSEEFIAAVEAAHRARPLDLVITYVHAAHLEPAAIERVRERIAPILNFHCNDIHQFHLVRPIARHFTLCLVPEREAIADYRGAGAEPFYWPMAANPAVYRPVPATPRYAASFAGQRYGDRTALVLALREAGVDTHVFGQGWAWGPASDASRTPAAERGAAGALAHLAGQTLAGRLPWRAVADGYAWRALAGRHAHALHPPLSDDAYVALFSESHISLGFLIVGDSHRTLRPLRQVRLREFEATMAGGFYLTGWIEELADLYEIGKEIVCYKSRAELVDLARWYLAHDTERDRVRRAGRARALRDHTWQRRFEGLFAELGRRGILRATVSA